MRSLLCLGPIVLLLVLPARAQTTITGRVTNLDDGGPLPGVLVRLCDANLPDASLQTMTNAQGRFALHAVPFGDRCLEAAYAVQDLRYVVQHPSVPVDHRPLTLHVVMPTALRERLQHAQAPTDPNPKSLSTITGLLEEGHVADARGTPLPGSRSRLEANRTGTLQGHITRGGVPAPNVHLLLPGLGLQARTGEDGRFVLPHIEPGTYPLLLIYHADTLTVPSLDVRTGRNEVNLSLDR